MGLGYYIVTHAQFNTTFQMSTAPLQRAIHIQFYSLLRKHV